LSGRAHGSKLPSAVGMVAAAAVKSLRKPPMPERPPLVSVITATFNWSSVLRCAIESVRRQTYPNWEMIVVGDACTDDSGEVVESFGDPRIQWHNRSVNAGSQGPPNNDGARIARGELIAYLGHDDLWAPDHLQRAVATLLAQRADVAFGLTEIIGPPGSGVRVLGGLTPRGGPTGGLIPTSSLVHRSGLLAEAGGWRHHTESSLPVDADLLARVRATGATFACSGSLTVFKFPSAMRPGSYRRRESFEQRELARRMGSERAFTQRELVRLVIARLRHDPSEAFARLPQADPSAEKGAWTREVRRIRGLDP
jgi:glycosyltransferase involved in cell wall biosynthesis